MKSPDLWEREAERETVATLLGGAARGRGGALFFVAQPGLGKSRLLQAADEAAGRRFLVVRASGHELETGYPFGLVHQALAALNRGTGARLVSSQPTLRGFARGRGRMDRTRLIYALFWFFTSLAERRPLLLLCDDLHWSDPDSLEFWRFLACRAEAQPVAIVGALRPWPPIAADVVGQLTASGQAVTMALRPLSPGATRGLLGESLGAAPTSALARQVQDLTGGNPLLIREVARLVRAGEQVPSGVDLLALRLGGLPGPARQLLGAASVLGSEFQLELALALCGLQEPDADAALQPLLALELLAPRSGSLAFTHPLLRQMAERALPPMLRAALHRRAVEILRARGAPASALVPHVLAAPAVDGADAIGTLQAAAAEAEEQAAHETAASHLRLARELRAPEPVRATILYHLGRAEQRAGDLRASAAAFAEAAALPGCPPRMRSAIRRSWALSLTMAGDTGAARDQLERAVADAVADGQPAEAAEFLVAKAVLEMTAGAFAAGRAASLRALALARRGRDSAALAKALAVWSNLAFIRGHPRAYARARAAAAMLPAAPPDEIEQFWGWSVPTALGMTAMRSERYAEAEALFAEMASAANRRRARYVSVWAFTFRAEVAWRQGRLREAARLVAEALDLPSEGPWATALALALRGYILVDLGAVEEAAPAIERAEKEALAVGLGPALLWAQAAGAALAASRGDHEAAAATLLATARHAAAIGLREPEMVPWQADTVDACIRCGRIAEAAEVAHALLADARRLGRPGLESVALRLEGMLATSADAALSAFRRAEAMQADLGLDLQRGRTLLAEGRYLRHAGSRTEAREVLARAEDCLAACGAERWRREAEAERLAAGGRRRRPEDPLTPQERRIADLVAQGRTNRQIAAVLLVSPKTLETHLRHIYAKLGCDSRLALQAKIRGEA
jgi:DNA-binding CsgD family transcriptional regulator